MDMTIGRTKLRKVTIDGTTYWHVEHAPKDGMTGVFYDAEIHVEEEYKRHPRDIMTSYDITPSFRWELTIEGLPQDSLRRITDGYSAINPYNNFTGESFDGRLFTGAMWCNSYIMSTDRKPSRIHFNGCTQLRERVKYMSQGQPAPYLHPESLSVGDRIKTDICPEGLHWDVKILNAFIVKDIGGVASIHNLDSFDLSTTKRNLPGTRCFVVWEQFAESFSSEKTVQERHLFAEHLKEHRVKLFSETTSSDVERAVRNLLYNGDKTPERIFATSEAYRLLDGKCTKRELGIGKNILTYDGVPIHEVAQISGIRVFKSGEVWEA